MIRQLKKICFLFSALLNSIISFFKNSNNSGISYSIHRVGKELVNSIDNANEDKTVNTLNTVNGSNVNCVPSSRSCPNKF